MAEVRGVETLRSYEEINEKIKRGDAVVLTAEEFIRHVEDSGVEAASREVDVVTTGTFGAMCSSGAFLNFGHSEPPIKMFKCWLNDVPAYKGLAAVDCYIGATAMSETKGFDYGGGHVIEDLVSGKIVELRAEAYGTDCYPRKSLETTVSLDDLNQAVLINPRNAYQRYNAATNGTDQILYTYMGTLLPRYANITYSGAGQLSPLYKDKNFETIGIGTRIFLGGGVGYVIGEGTQHSPQNQFGTISVRGDLKQMSGEYLKGATFHNYGTTMYVGIGIPVPIINEKVAASAAIKDSEIHTDVLDYGVPSRSRPTVKKVSYADLKSGSVEISGRDIPTSSMSSYKKASEIADTLRMKILEKSFLLTRPVELLPDYREFKPLQIKRKEPVVQDIMTVRPIVGKLKDSVRSVAKVLTESGIDHLPIVNDEGVLVGIVTSWDIAKAIAHDGEQLVEIMTTKVITAKGDELIDVIARRMAQHKISGLPVVDQLNHVIGILTTDDISKKLVGRRVQ